MCWNGILSANWKDAEIDFQTDACYCRNPVKRISRMEKAIFPRDTGSKKVTISHLLPKIKNDSIDDFYEVLKISSVVDGTDVRGFGQVRNHTYRWKMAIESAVQSIAVVPDRFFDVKGTSYSIDWNRKVSVNSLPTYENYKDAIIYRINTREKCKVPPLAKIIYDAAMISKGELVEVSLSAVRPFDDTESHIHKEAAQSITFSEILIQSGYTVYGEGFIEKDGEYFIPLKSYLTEIDYTSYDEEEDIYSWAIEEVLFKVNDTSILPTCKTKIDIDSYSSTLVNYLQNHAATDLIQSDHFGSVKVANATIAIEKGDYLAIIVDNNDNYIPLIGQIVNKINPVESLDDEDANAKKTVIWYKPAVDIEVSQFKGLDMWLKFKSINAMIYFILTKYEDNIISINAATIKALNNNNSRIWGVNENKTTINRNSDEEADKVEGRLWAYINPRTMQPYDDDYWFHQGEPYYIKSLTIAQGQKTLKANRIVIKADQWPGVYMLVGETYIRNRDTGLDERLQLKIPMCKVKSNQSLSLEAGGDPVTFSMELEVAKPRSGHLMEITAYEVGTKMVDDGTGCFYAVDGSSEVIME